MENTKRSLKEIYNIGTPYEFKVKQPYSNYCELIDEKSGITTYLQGTEKLKLYRGQTVTCRITDIDENKKHPKIVLVDISEYEQSPNNLTEEKLSLLLSQNDISWNTKEFIKLLLTEEKDTSFEWQCCKWIHNLLRKNVNLNKVLDDCSTLLELSELLNRCSENEREIYQTRLTLLIEQLEYYIEADKLIKNENIEGVIDTPTTFIDKLYQKLKMSGFIYHPEKNFGVLSCLFLLYSGLMNSRIGELFEIVQGRDIRFWRKEPFRNQLVKLFELYIRECDGKIDETKENQDLIKSNMLALALQLLLLDNKKDISIADYRLNCARLCNISSYLNKLESEHLIDMAYCSLFHSEIKNFSYGFDNINNVQHIIANSYTGENIDTINSFTQNNLKLLVSSDGIQLCPSKTAKKTYPVFPKELNLWKNMQVYLNAKPETKLTAIRPHDLTSYQNVWNEIEFELFNKQTKVSEEVSTKKKKQHRTGETVNIVFTSQDKHNNKKYYCHIEDEIGGEGYINIDDIVPYFTTTNLQSFFASDGSRYVFEAKIIDKEDELFHFQMQDIIKDKINNKFNNFYSEDEDIICSVGTAPNIHGAAPAVSEEGISISIKNAGDFEEIKQYDMVRCQLIGKASGTFHIECEMKDYYDSSKTFNIAEAFKFLMEEISVGRIPDMTELEEEQILEIDTILDKSYVKELVYMIDRMAILDNDYVKSYNYLAFARILCLLIGWDSQAAYYKGRMNIITMLYYFATNNEVNEEDLNKLENANVELFQNNVLLQERFLQLKIVSYIGKVNHNDDLYGIAQNNSQLRELALLVLAYNITNASKMNNVTNDIHNKIKQLLNLKGHETGLKKYGSGNEGENVEFKSSIVFCAGEKDANQEKQINEILKVINSFFNTTGGTLYIGVNDSGLGIGVEDDLNSCLYYGNKDQYLRNIRDAIAKTWKNSVLTSYVESIEFDENNVDKDVVIVKIKPIENGISFNGKEWYVRSGSEKRALSKEEYDEYRTKNRGLPSVPTQETHENKIPVQNERPTIQNAITQLITSKDDEIKTSKIRKNIKVDYEDSDNYVEPIALFKFLNNGKFIKIDKYDYDDSSLLTLVVKEDEKKGFLILGYDNGNIAKVSVDDLLNYESKEYSRNTDTKLLFATIANEDDAILTISKESKSSSKAVMRLDCVSKFSKTTLTGNGEIKFKQNLISKILAFEVIPAKNKMLFKGILDKKDSFVGSAAKSDKNIVDKLHDLGYTEIYEVIAN